MIDIKTLKLTALFKANAGKAKPHSAREADQEPKPKQTPEKEGVLSLGQPTVSGVRRLVDKI